MDISRAFGYAFQDEEWTGKLTILVAIVFMSLITTPLLIGLVGWATVLGYTVELVRNIRDQHPTPLPRWDNYGDKISQGASVLTALFVYALPNFLLTCCVVTTSNFWGDGFTGSAMGLGVMCCIVPLVLIYNLITWPMIALGLARYAEERNIGVFFQFGDLFDTLRQNFGTTFQWVLYTLLANLIIGILGIVPCIGWIIAPTLAVVVQGYLTATLGDMIETPMRAPSKPKRKPY